MSKIFKAFDNNKAFIAFITGGDPDIETTENLILTMERAGVDIIEIGIPFSDPVAEGPVIQAADERALKAGVTVDKLFYMIEKLRKTTDIPLAFMSYINPIFRYGKKKFTKNCANVGIDAVIIPDLPFEERDEIKAECETCGLDLINMIAPTSNERTEKIAKDARGFLYCVSSLGVTGVRTNISHAAEDMIARVRNISNVPCAVGFGVSSRSQIEKILDFADGVIVGSAIVKIIQQNGKESCKYVYEFIKSLIP